MKCRFHEIDFAGRESARPLAEFDVLPHNIANIAGMLCEYYRVYDTTGKLQEERLPPTQVSVASKVVELYYGPVRQVDLEAEAEELARRVIRQVMALEVVDKGVWAPAEPSSRNKNADPLQLDKAGHVDHEFATATVRVNFLSNE